MNSALQRARKTIDETGCPSAASRRRCARSATTACARWSRATWTRWERGDVDAVTAMLAEDATITMPPMATWFHGRGRRDLPDRVGVLRAAPYNAEGRRNVRVLRAHANGQPAIGTYSWDDERGAHLPTVLRC